MIPADLRIARKALGLDAAQELLERHGVSDAAIRFVRAGATWGHVE